MKKSSLFLVFLTSVLLVFALVKGYRIIHHLPLQPPHITNRHTPKYKQTPHNDKIQLEQAIRRKLDADAKTITPYEKFIPSDKKINDSFFYERRLANIYTQMSPNRAAQIIETMEKAQAAFLLKSMRAEDAAAIMSHMETQKAKEITEFMLKTTQLQ